MQREHPRKRSLDQLVDVVLADCRARNLSPRTIEHYDWAIRSFRSSRGADPESQVLADLEPEAVRDWIASLAQTRKPVSVRSAVRGLKVLGRWVAREGYSSADPLAPVRLPKAPPSLIMPLSGEQVAALMEAGNPVLRTAVAIARHVDERVTRRRGLGARTRRPSPSRPSRPPSQRK